MNYLTKTFRTYFPSSFLVSGLIAALMFLICLAAVQSASAATYTVTTTADSDAGSLRAAIASANGTLEPDTIEFAISVGDTGCTGEICTITLTSGELAVNSASTAGSLTINNATDASNLVISGNNTSRVFFVNFGANLTISGLTITKGNGTSTTNAANNGAGGGIFNTGTLTLINSTVSGNTASNIGGGIINGLSSGTLTIANSTVSDNTAGGFGGGISTSGMTALTNSTVSGNTAPSGGGIYISNRTTTLVNSTVSGNTAESGGGIFNGGGTTTLTNSTVSGNTASNSGGGIINAFTGTSLPTLNLTSVTVTQNKSTSTTCTNCAGGIRNTGTANLKNTIVAGNTVANAFSSPDFGGAVAATSSYNLIGNGQGTTGISNADANSNQVGTPGNSIDPKLAPLANNGGATQTHALLFGSPALDKGNSFGLTTDQRGFARPFDNPGITNATGGDGADIGAFEVQAAPTAATVSIGGRVMTMSGRGIVNVRLTLTDSNGQVRTTTTTSLGYYRFDDVQAGETYILSASGKHYAFSQPLQVLNINDETNEINFIANSEKRLRIF